MRARRRSLAAWAVLAVLLLLLAGCAIGGDTGELPQNALDPAPGSVAQEQDALWNLVFPIAVGVFVLVQGLILFAVFRFRDRGGRADEPPKQVAGNTRLEILWTIIPALILAAIAVPTVQTIFNLASAEPDAMNVRVIAKQYWWEFQYEDPEQEGVITATQLHIPVGREVQLNMQSVSSQQPYDPSFEGEEVQPRGAVALGVNHSFWVPRLAGKMDVVPGHTRQMVLRTDEPGLYPGQCAEFCGLSHPNMRFSVLAQTPEEFDAWIAEQAEDAEVVDEGLAAEGQQLFVDRQCVTCHSVEGHPDNLGLRIGPSLTHFASRETFAGGILDTDDPDALAAWLRNPQAEKPGSQMPNLNLSEEDIDALVAYLQTLD